MLFGRIFNRSNLTKLIIIFFVGLVSRSLVLYLYKVNVVFDILNKISIIYYAFFSGFIVLVHELVGYFNFNIIPTNFIQNIKLSFSYIYNLLSNKNISFFKLKDFKFSNLKKAVELFFNKEKMAMGPLENKVEKANNGSIKKPVITGKLEKNGEGSNSTSRGHSENNSNESRSNRSRSNRSRSNIRTHSELTVRNRNDQGRVAEAEFRRRPDDLIFVVDNTVTPSTTQSSLPPMPDAPIPSALSTPSTIYSSLFPEPLRPTVPQSYSPLPPMPSAPRPSALSTPSTMTPLFRSYASSINSTNVVNPAEVETVINREYANRDNNLKGKVSEPVSRSYGYTYPVPGTAPYFNPARSSLESNQATMGLNGSNEQMM